MAKETAGSPAQRTALQESRSFTIVLIGGIMFLVLLVCGLTIWNVQAKVTSDDAIEKAYNVQIVAHGKEETLLVRSGGRSVQCDRPVDLSKAMTCQDSVKIAAVNP
jgi:hypothetical protein